MADKTYRIGSLKSGRVYCVAPYHPEFVDHAHNLMGKWQTVTLSGTDTQCWTFDAAHREKLERLCADLWPDASEMVECIIEYDSTEDDRRWMESSPGHFENGVYIPGDGHWEPIGTRSVDMLLAEPTLDGLRLCSFGRDFVGRVNHEAVIEVLENTLRSGGSRNNPRIGGRLVVRARIRRGGIAVWGTEPRVTMKVKGEDYE